MQKATENVLESPKYRFLQGNRSQGIECRCQNFNLKLIEAFLCMRSENVAKNPLNAAKSPKFETLNRKW